MCPDGDEGGGIAVTRVGPNCSDDTLEVSDGGGGILFDDGVIA